VARVRSLAIPGLFGGGEGAWRGEGLSGAGPAGWLRESGSRLPQPRAFGWRVGMEAWGCHVFHLLHLFQMGGMWCSS
jgi:hypothetical protein